MSTLSFWLMLLIERRVGLTARHVAHSLLMRVMSAWLYIVEWWPELRRDNDCMVLGPQQTMLTERQYWLTLTWNWLEINTAWQWLMPRRLSLLCRVYVVISCQVSQICCTGPPPGAAVSGHSLHSREWRSQSESDRARGSILWHPQWPVQPPVIDTPASPASRASSEQLSSDPQVRHTETWTAMTTSAQRLSMAEDGPQKADCSEKVW